MSQVGEPQPKQVTLDIQSLIYELAMAYKQIASHANGLLTVSLAREAIQQKLVEANLKIQALTKRVEELSGLSGREKPDKGDSL